MDIGTPLYAVERNGHEWTIIRLHRAIPQMGRFIVYCDGQIWNMVDNYKKGIEEIEKGFKVKDKTQTQEAEPIEPELDGEELEP